MHISEMKLINKIAGYLNINQYDFDSIHSMFLAESIVNRLDKWYSIIEIDKNASDADIKKAHRNMVIKHYPDKLKDVSEDIVKIAEEKFLLVQKSYEEIKKNRA